MRRGPRLTRGAWDSGEGTGAVQHGHAGCIKGGGGVWDPKGVCTRNGLKKCVLLPFYCTLCILVGHVCYPHSQAMFSTFSSDLFMTVSSIRRLLISGLFLALSVVLGRRPKATVVSWYQPYPHRAGMCLTTGGGGAGGGLQRGHTQVSKRSTHACPGQQFIIPPAPLVIRGKRTSIVEISVTRFSVFFSAQVAFFFDGKFFLV